MTRLICLFCLATALTGGGQEYQPLMTWGERGNAPGQFRGAHGITVDKGDEVIVIDSRNSHIYRFTAEGKLLNEIGGGPGDKDGQFAMPRDAAVNAAGEVYVADGANNRIQVFSHDGKFLRAFGGKGSGQGQFLRAHALAFDQKGRLFIADVDNSRIAVYDAKDQLLMYWGKAGTAPGEFHAPHGLGIDPQGNVIVSNYYGPLQKFTPEGKLLAEFGAFTPENNLLSYHSMCVDPEGNIFISTRDKQRRSMVTKYSNDGKLLAQWPMANPAHFIEDVAVDSKGRVYATFQGRQGTGVEVFSPK